MSNKLKSYMESVALESIEKEEIEEVSDEQLELAVLKVEEADKELEASDSDIEEMEEITAGLESIADSLTTALESGGLDPVAAQFAHLAVGAHTARLAIPSDTVVPSLEDFAGDTGAEASTKVAIEGIGDVIKKIWAAIKAAVKTAIAKIATAFAAIFGGTKKVLARLEALEKSVKETAKDLDKDAKLKVGNPSAVKIDNKVSIKVLMDGVKLANLFSKDNMSGFVKDTEDLLKERLSTFDKVVTDTESVFDGYDAKAQEIVKLVESKAQGKVLPGDKAVETTVQTGFAVRKIVSAEGAKTFTGDAEVSPMNKSDLLKFIADIKTAVKGLDDAKKGVEKIEKLEEDYGKKVEDLVSKANKDEAIAAFFNKRQGKALMSSTKRGATKSIARISSYVFFMARTYLSIAEDNAKLFDVKEEKEEKK